MVLGRSAGLSEAQLRHLVDDPVPEDVYDPAERAAVEYARRSTRMEPISDELYGRLTAHFSTEQVMELCFTVGLSNLINRFHATFLTDVDPETGEVLAPTCPLPIPEPLRERAEEGWRRSAGGTAPGDTTPDESAASPPGNPPPADG